MTFDEFVEERISSVPEEDMEPFCPFRTPNAMGYCDCAYSESCYSCEESLGEYVMRYRDPDLFDRVNTELRNIHDLSERVRTAEKLVEDFDKA